MERLSAPLISITNLPVRSRMTPTQSQRGSLLVRICVDHIFFQCPRGFSWRVDCLILVHCRFHRGRSQLWYFCILGIRCVHRSPYTLARVLIKTPMVESPSCSIRWLPGTMRSSRIEHRQVSMPGRLVTPIVASAKGYTSSDCGLTTSTPQIITGQAWLA